jgi:serine/threonine protein kinase
MEADDKYIVKMVQGFQDETRLYFLMEYLHGGILRDHFTHSKPFDEA